MALCKICKQVRQGGGCGGRGGDGRIQALFSADDDSKATAQTAYPSKLEAAVVSKHSIWDMDMAPQEKQTPSKSSEVPSPLPAQDVTDKIPYPASMEGNDGVIENTPTADMTASSISTLTAAVR